MGEMDYKYLPVSAGKKQKELDEGLEAIIHGTLELDGPQEERTYHPGIVMRGLVRVLKATNTADREDVSHLPRAKRIVHKYIRHPKNYLLSPAAGFIVRASVGATSGQIMRDAASYLESEVGIKEDPLEYTRYNLMTLVTMGFPQMVLTSLGIASLPHLVPVPKQLAGTMAVVYPVTFLSDAVRRFYLYSKGKPSGAILLEGAWWLKEKAKQHVISPVVSLYEGARDKVGFSSDDAPSVG